MDLTDKIKARLWDHYSYEHGRDYTREEMAGLITDVVLDHVDSAVAWWTAEIQLLRQENEQLKVDLMVADEMFDAIPPRKNGVPMINIKRRSNFRYEK